MWTNGLHDVKLLFFRERVRLVACCLDSQVSSLRCTIAWAGASHLKNEEKKNCPLILKKLINEEKRKRKIN